MMDPELYGDEGPNLLRRTRRDNEAVVPPGREGPGATAIDRRIALSAPPEMTGLELIAEQQAWNMAHSSDPARVPQGPHLGQPPQLPRLVVILLGLLGTAGAIWLLRELSWLLAPMFLGLNMVIVVFPVQTFLRRHGVPKGAALALTGLTLVAVLSSLSLLGGWAIAQMVDTFPQYLPKVIAFYEQVGDWLVNRGIVDREAFSNTLTNVNPANLILAVGQVFSGFSGMVGMVGVVLSAIIMMMLDAGSWGRRITVAGSTHPRIVAAMRAFSEGIRRYWVVSTGFGALMAGLNYIELLILRVPLPVVWALLTWLMTYVPSVGFFFSLIPPLVVAQAANGWQTAQWVVGVYMVSTGGVQGVFQPKFTGEAVGVNATVALISLLFWAWVFGPLGALIALPCTQLVKSLLIDADPRARWTNSLLSSQPEVRGAASQA